MMEEMEREISQCCKGTSTSFGFSPWFPRFKFPMISMIRSLGKQKIFLDV
jgi:hypothetical protein